MYKSLDPATRVVILKALCDIRVEVLLLVYGRSVIQFSINSACIYEQPLYLSLLLFCPLFLFLLVVCESIAVDNEFSLCLQFCIAV